MGIEKMTAGDKVENTSEAKVKESGRDGYEGWSVKERGVKWKGRGQRPRLTCDFSSGGRMFF